MVHVMIKIFQPALPAYRIDFFDRIDKKTNGELSVFFSPKNMDVLTEGKNRYKWAHPIGRIHAIPGGGEWQIGAMSVKIDKGDIVVISGNPRCLSSLLLILKCKLLGVKTVWWGHYWSSTSKYYRFYIRMILMKLVDSVLFYTDREVADYKAGFGRHDKRLISALNNGLNIDPIKKYRAIYTAAQRPVAILFIGRLEPKSEIESLILSLRNERLSNVTIQVIGGGPDLDRLKNYASDLGVDNRIFWNGGSVDEEVISEVANKCRIFVYPGAVGLSLIHAMAYGLPAVINNSDRKNGPEIAAFRDEKTGLSFDIGNQSSLEEKIIDLIFNEKKLDQMSSECSFLVDGVFNTEEMSKRLLKHVEESGLNN